MTNIEKLEALAKLAGAPCYFSATTPGAVVDYTVALRNAAPELFRELRELRSVRDAAVNLMPYMWEPHLEEEQESDYERALVALKRAIDAAMEAEAKHD